jgi:hypothetical protein
MPTSQDVLYRLLDLYPVEVLKANWTAVRERTKDAVISKILSTTQESAIFTFCQSEQEVTKQHLFFFEHDGRNLRSFPNPLLSNYTPVTSSRTTSSIQEFYLIPVIYKVVLGPPYRDVELQFLWPISILIESTSAIGTFTILEKKIDAYLPSGERALNTQRDLEEESILQSLKDNLSVSLTTTDLHKGIKKLWTTDKIDAPQARWKPAKATVVQTMDRTYLLKRDDPTAFDKAIKEPLLKTLFVVVDSNSDYDTHFSVSPQDGEIMFNRYGKPGEVANVVRAILRAN